MQEKIKNKNNVQENLKNNVKKKTKKTKCKKI